MSGRRIVAGAVLAASILEVLPTAQAILFFETSDPAHNTTAPAGALADSGWQWQGRWGAFLGTPVHPKFFLTARHIGGSIGSALLLNGRSYVTTAFTNVPGSELRLWRICDEFAQYAPLHTNGTAVGRSLVWFGRGTQRGTEVLFTNDTTVELRGWRPGASDGVLRWGQNRVEGIYEDPALGPLLRATFDAAGGANECHLTTGDSGGAAFLREGNRWELAGIHYAVDGPYRYPEGGDAFPAALFNHQGFTWEDEGLWVPTTETDQPEAGALYTSDVSAHAQWILDYLNQAPMEDLPVLQQSSDAGAGFSDAVDAQVNPQERTIRLPRPERTRFYRLRSCSPSRITDVFQAEGALVLAYEQ